MTPPPCSAVKKICGRVLTSKKAIGGGAGKVVCVRRTPGCRLGRPKGCPRVHCPRENGAAIAFTRRGRFAVSPLARHERGSRAARVVFVRKAQVDGTGVDRGSAGRLVRARVFTQRENFQPFRKIMKLADRRHPLPLCVPVTRSVLVFFVLLSLGSSRRIC